MIDLSGNVTYFFIAIVGYCDLSSPDVEDVLRRQSEHKRMRGIRQMLNYHSEHPQYCAVSHDNYLTDPNWIKGFSLLEKYNLSFELHILPRQMKRCHIVCTVCGSLGYIRNYVFDLRNCIVT